MSSSAQQAGRVSAEQIRVVAQGSNVSLLASTFALLLIGGSILGEQSSERLQAAAAWWAALMLVLLYGIYLVRKILKASDRDDEVQRLGTWIAVNAAISGTLWGAATWILLPTDSAQSELLVLVGLAVALMGGASAQAAYKPVDTAFTFTLACVVIAGLVRFQDPFHTFCAVAFGMFWFVTAMSSRILWRTLDEKIGLALELDVRTEEAQKAQAQSEAARKASETAREESETARREAELASRAKTVFLTSASHDMRQPLQPRTAQSAPHELALQRIERPRLFCEAMGHGERG